MLKRIRRQIFKSDGRSFPTEIVFFRLLNIVNEGYFDFVRIFILFNMNRDTNVRV